MYKKRCILLCWLLCCCLFFGCSSSLGSDFNLEETMEELREIKKEMLKEQKIAEDAVNQSTADETDGDYYKVRPEGGFTFGFLCRDLGNYYYTPIEKVIREAVEANKDTLITYDSKENAGLQKRQVEKLIDKQVDGVFFCPVDKNKAVEMTDLLREHGILVVNFDTQFNDSKEAAISIVSDNYNAGYLCGEDLVLNHKPGDAAVFATRGVQSLSDRVTGFLAAIQGSSNFHCACVVDVPSSEKEVKKALHELLADYPAVRYILATSDIKGEYILDELEKMGRRDVYIYSIDGSPPMKERLLKGNTGILGLAVQSPINIGMYSASAMYQLLDGRRLENIYYVETFLIKKDEIEEYGINHWQ